MVAGAIILALSIGTVGILKAFQKQAGNSTSSTKTTSKKSRVISTLGKIEPAGQVVQVSGPPGERILRLLVKEGQQLEKGEAIAFLESYPERKAEVEKATNRLFEIKNKSEVEYKRAQLQDARIRRNPAENPETRVSVAQDIVRQSEVESEKAQARLNRYRDLLKAGAVSQKEVNDQVQFVRSQQQQLNNANATLAMLQEVQQTGSNTVKTTAEALKSQVQIDFASAKSTLDLAKARLARAIILAPKKGQVLKVKIREGEAIPTVTNQNSGSPKSIVEMGDTRQMYVVAQVYDTDVNRVQIGQSAKISSPVFKGEIEGTIDKVGLTIGKNDVVNTDPAAKTNRRVVEVKIRLNNSIAVSGLTNLQVDVAIQPPKG